MRGKTKTKRFSFAITLAFGTAIYAIFLRKRLLQWGATNEQARSPLPGDELVPDPNYQSTHAITICAAPKIIWSWIKQIGYQRAGFYSYDALERWAGLKDLHSSDQIVPDWQEIQAGDTISISPETPLNVAILEPERAMVLHIDMNPFTARPINRSLQPDGPSMDWSWAFVLEPASPQATRLIVRVRANFQPQPLGNILTWLVLEPVHFLMESRMLRGIRARAEAPKTIYHRMKSLNTRMVRNYRRGLGPTRRVLLLTTTGRKSGQPRVTPLQFEEVAGDIYIASARGQEADWFKNILANPSVHLQIGKREFEALAEPVTDAGRIADFMELRLSRHPLIIRLIMHLFDGLPLLFKRADLEAYSAGKALVILHLSQ